MLIYAFNITVFTNEDLFFIFRQIGPRFTYGMDAFQSAFKTGEGL